MIIQTMWRAVLLERLAPVSPLNLCSISCFSHQDLLSILGPPVGCADPNAYECPASIGGCCPNGQECYIDTGGTARCDNTGIFSSSSSISVYTPPIDTPSVIYAPPTDTPGVTYTPPTDTPSVIYTPPTDTPTVIYTPPTNIYTPPTTNNGSIDSFSGTDTPAPQTTDVVAYADPSDPRISYVPSDAWSTTSSSSSVGVCKNGTKVASQADASIQFPFEGSFHYFTP